MNGFMEKNWTYNDKEIEKFLDEYRGILDRKNNTNIERKIDYIVTSKELIEGKTFGNLIIKKVLSNRKYNIYGIGKINIS